MKSLGQSTARVSLSQLEHGFGNQLRQRILHQNLLAFLWTTIIAGILTILLPSTLPWLVIASGFSVYICLNIVALYVCGRGQIKLAAMGYTAGVVCVNASAIIATGSLDTHFVISLVNLILFNGFFVGARGALALTLVSIVMVIGSSMLGDGIPKMGLGDATLAQLNVATATTVLSTGFVMASGVRLLQGAVQTSAFAIAELQNARDNLDERHQRAKELASLGELVIRTKSLDEMLQSFVDILLARPEILNVSILDPYGNILLENTQGTTEGLRIGQLVETKSESASGALQRYSDQSRQILWMKLGLQDETFGILVLELPTHESLVDDQELFIGAAAGMIGAGLKRLESEQSLRQAQRLESIGKLAGSVAHDFNNMLTSIIGCNELTKKSLAPEHPAHTHLEISEIASQQAAALVNKLLTFAQARPRKPERFDLSQFLSKRESFLRNFMNDNIDLRFEVEGPDLWILADPVDIEQIFVNLLINARNVLPSSGTVVVRIKRTSDSFVQIEVADSGPGIPKKDRMRAFEPFFTTRSGQGGTGLGLPTVKAIINENQGQIRIETAREGGASIVLEWPLAQKPERSSQDSINSQDFSLPKLSILVVDDDPLVRATIVKLLEELQLSATAVEGSRQALEEFETRKHFDLIITDFMMPEMNGAQLIEELRKLECETPIILMSGYDDYQELAQGTDYLPNTRIQKPITLPQLRKTLLETHRQTSAKKAS